jgi:hypothetical protein
MKMTLFELRSIVRNAIHEESWVPSRWMPDDGGPADDEDLMRMDDDFGSIDEVDLDPSNNPGRPADPYEYLGMHPAPTAAMSHPYATGGGSAAPGAYPASNADSGGGESFGGTSVDGDSMDGEEESPE